MGWFFARRVPSPHERNRSRQWWNRVCKRRRRKVLAEHHRKVLKAIQKHKGQGTQCPPHPRRPTDWL